MSKAIVDQKLLSKEIKKISPLISKNLVLPVLEYIKLDFNKKVLKLTGTNLNTTIYTEMECENKTPFSVLIPASDLADICDKAAGPMTISEEENIIKIVHDKGSFKIPKRWDAKDFPAVEEGEFYITALVGWDFFYSLTGALSCGSKNEMATNLVNAAIDFKKTKITVVGTDANILYKKDFPVSCKQEKIAQVPKEFVNLTKIFQDSEISVGDKFIKAEYMTTIVIGRLSENKYVDYSVIIPKSVNFNLTIDRNDLIKAISIVGVAIDHQTNHILISFKPGKILVDSEDYITQKEARSEVIAEHSIDRSPLKINGSALLTILNTLCCDTIKISMPDGTGLLYVHPEDDEAILCLIGQLVN